MSGAVIYLFDDLPRGASFGSCDIEAVIGVLIVKAYLSIDMLQNGVLDGQVKDCS